ncbi:MAG: T9SS type A sorting domain-containing protein [Bacteroidales bacterium]|nr:T9SS type A sorting domain-containing protein [Bacteroidales bacterium]
MKKIYMKLFAVLFTGLISVSIYAQGTWKADSLQEAINASTEIPIAITGITCMHSDAQTVTGKGDTGAETVVYNEVTYDNLAFIQGSTNGMYYAFRTAQDGTLDISVKMGGGKKTFIVELTDACPDYDNLTALTTNFATGDAITTMLTYFTLPSVYDTQSQSEKTWDGSVAPVEATTYMVFSWPVSANKTYIAGCFGSKMMLRGINYKTTASGLIDNATFKTSDIYPNPANGRVFFKLEKSAEIGIYNTVGILVKQKLVTPSNNSIDISGLQHGVYFVKDVNSDSKVQKLVIK